MPSPDRRLDSSYVKERKGPAGTRGEGMHESFIACEARNYMRAVAIGITVALSGVAPVAAHQTTSAAGRSATLEAAEDQVTVQRIAAHFAPTLWLAPGEPCRPTDITKTGACGGEELIVYYQLRRINTTLPAPRLAQVLPMFGDVHAAADSWSSTWQMNLSTVSEFEIRYFYYYRQDVGYGGHPDDLESSEVQIAVVKNGKAAQGSTYELSAVLLTGQAHGVGWYSNQLRVGPDTRFPLRLLVEKGKHAVAPDANWDGRFTLGIDVTEQPGEAWGVRDTLFGGHQISGSWRQDMMLGACPGKVNRATSI